MDDDIKDSFKENEEAFTKIYLYWQLFTTLALMMPLVISLIIFGITICIIVIVFILTILVVVIYSSTLGAFIIVSKVMTILLYPFRLTIFKMFKGTFEDARMPYYFNTFTVLCAWVMAISRS